MSGRKAAPGVGGAVDRLRAALVEARAHPRPGAEGPHRPLVRSLTPSQASQYPSIVRSSVGHADAPQNFGEGRAGRWHGDVV